MTNGKVVGTGKIRGNVADLGKDSLYSALSVGAKFFDPSLNVSHFKAGWESDCPLIFMPVGELDEESNIKPAFNFSTGEPLASNFYQRLPVVRYFGSARRVEFPLFDPFAAHNGTYDPARNPYIVLRNAIQQWSKRDTHAKWKTLLDKPREAGDKEGAVLPKYSEHYFFHGLVYQDGRGYVGDAKGTPRGLQSRDTTLSVISCSRNAGEQLINLVEHYANGKGVPGAEELNLLNGKHPHFIVMSNPKKHPEQVYNPAAARGMVSDMSASVDMDMDVDMESQFQSQLGQLDVDDDAAGGGFSQYVVTALPSVTVSIKKGKAFKAAPFPPFPFGKIERWMNKIRQNYRPIQDLFNIPTHEEQIRMICSALEDKPELLQAAFPENSEHCTEDVRRTVNNRSAMRLRGSLDLGDDLQQDPMAFMTGGTDPLLSGEDLRGNQSQSSGMSVLDDLLGLGDGSFAKAKDAMKAR